MCVPWAFAEHALALFGDAKQAMGEGKSGPVETRLTALVATALLPELAKYRKLAIFVYIAHIYVAQLSLINIFNKSQVDWVARIIRHAAILLLVEHTSVIR